MEGRQFTLSKIPLWLKYLLRLVAAFGEGRILLDHNKLLKQPGKDKTDLHFQDGAYLSSICFQFLDTAYYTTFFQHMVP